MVSVPLPAGHASTVASVLAARTASRSEQSPSLFSSSAVVVTLIVAAPAGCAAISPGASTTISNSGATQRPAAGDRRWPLLRRDIRFIALFPRSYSMGGMYARPNWLTLQGTA